MCRCFFSRLPKWFIYTLRLSSVRDLAETVGELAKTVTILWCLVTSGGLYGRLSDVRMSTSVASWQGCHGYTWEPLCTQQGWQLATINKKQLTSIADFLEEFISVVEITHRKSMNPGCRKNVRIIIIDSLSEGPPTVLRQKQHINHQLNLSTKK